MYIHVDLRGSWNYLFYWWVLWCGRGPSATYNYIGRGHWLRYSFLTTTETFYGSEFTIEIWKSFTHCLAGLQLQHKGQLKERERESIFFLYFESKDIKLIEKKTDVSLNIKVD